MRQRLSLFILLVWTMVLCPIRAQLLYEVSGNGARAKSYILATNKNLDLTFLDTIPNVFKAFSTCRQVINEFSISDYEALSALRQAAVLPDSVRLSNYYSEQQYQEIDDALQITLGMSLSQLCRMKPSYLTEMYRAELMKRWLGYDEQRSMDKFFEVIAMEQSIPVYGLDNVGETMYMLFDREPLHWQFKELENIILYPEREVNLERHIMAHYQQGRLNDIAFEIEAPDNLSTLSYSDYQVYEKRNRQWVKRLTPYLKQGKAFITLDSIYLGGDKGLIAMLRAAGFRVRAANTPSGRLR